MEMQPGELIDKYTIARLYRERDNGDIKEEGRLNAGVSEVKRKHPDLLWDELIDVMYTINGTIWDYEAPIHSGKMDGDPVIAGILSLRVRKFNVIRVKMSKLINKLVEKDGKG